MKIGILIDKSFDEHAFKDERKEEVEREKFVQKSIDKVLKDNKYEVFKYFFDEDVVKKLREDKIDLVFNLCNGSGGEYSLLQAPAMLEFAKIPYTASSPLGHGIAYNKIRTSRVLTANKIYTPKFYEIDDIEDIEDVDWEYPLLVKPKDEGSSRGIRNDSLVYNYEELKNVVERNLQHYNPPIMINEYIEGTEVTVGVLGNGKDIEVLPVLEIDFSGLPEGVNKIYSFEVKYKYEDETNYYIPARLDSETKSAVEKASIKAFKALGLSDYARVDIRIKNGKPYIIEINSLPGLDKTNSDIIKMAEAGGLTYEDLVLKIIDIAKKRLDIK